VKPEQFNIFGRLVQEIRVLQDFFKHRARGKINENICPAIENYEVIQPQEKMTLICPVCGKKDHLACDDDLGEDGLFYSCHEHRGGCGSTFRITPNGECVDIF
jgi:hypothetical protein